MRKPIIAGNWKMNNTVAAGTALVKELAPLVKDNNAVDIVVCPTFTALAAVCEAVKGLAFVKLLKLCLMKLLAMLFVFNMAEV